MWKEGIPKSEYLIPIDNYLLSAFGSCIYQVKSYPFCRLYWDEGKPTPNLNESSWYPVGDRWKRNGPNFPSYEVVIVNLNGLVTTGQFPLTLRWNPIHHSSFEFVKSQIPLVKEAKVKEFNLKPMTPDVKIEYPSWSYYNHVKP